MSPKTPRPRSLALLPHLPLTFSSQVHLLPFHQPRLLTLRGPLILLSKSSSPTPRVLLLSPTAPPRPSATTHILLPNLRISFQDSSTRNRFLRAASLALSRLSPGLPNYLIRNPLGRGSEAFVYLVQRRSDGARFAMKTVPKEHAFLTHSRLDSLIAERVALVDAARRDSPFIVRLVDAFETDTHLCFVTRLADHGDLRALLPRLARRRFSEPVARRLFAEALLGLEECHRMGYLFRDMKLGNLLLDKNGHVRLADFGLAKRLKVRYDGTPRSSVDSVDVVEDDHGFRLVGRTKSFVGTRRYMSPEHISTTKGRKRGYGAEADVWALGVSLYVMVAGEYPFGRGVSARDAAAVFRAIGSEPLRFPSWLGAQVKSLLSGMLERDPRRRLTVKGIKEHDWMHGVDWERVRAEAAAGVRQEEVVEELRESGIVHREGVGEGEDDKERDWSVVRYSIGSTVSCDSLDSRASFRASLRKSKAAGPELAGFSYMDWMDYR